MKRVLLACAVLLIASSVADAAVSRSRSVQIQRSRGVNSQAFRRQNVTINNFNNGFAPVGANAFFFTPNGAVRVNSFHSFGTFGTFGNPHCN